MPDTEKYQRSKVWMMKVGDDVARAMPVFGIDVPGVDIGAAEIPIAGVTHDGRWALGYVFNGTQREIGLFAAPAAGVLAGKPKWRRVIHPRDEVTGVAYFNDTLALLSHKDAPRSQVLRIDLKKPELVEGATAGGTKRPRNDRNHCGSGCALYRSARRQRQASVQTHACRPQAMWLRSSCRLKDRFS